MHEPNGVELVLLNRLYRPHRQHERHGGHAVVEVHVALVRCKGPVHRRRRLLAGVVRRQALWGEEICAQIRDEGHAAPIVTGARFSVAVKKVCVEQHNVTRPNVDRHVQRRDAEEETLVLALEHGQHTQPRLEITAVSVQRRAELGVDSNRAEDGLEESNLVRDSLVLQTVVHGGVFLVQPVEARYKLATTFERTRIVTRESRQPTLFLVGRRQVVVVTYDSAVRRPPAVGQLSCRGFDGRRSETVGCRSPQLVGDGTLEENHLHSTVDGERPRARLDAGEVFLVAVLIRHAILLGGLGLFLRRVVVVGVGHTYIGLTLTWWGTCGAVVILPCTSKGK
eukprot:PhM_4_TR2172/c0_g1_i1/m.54064